MSITLALAAAASQSQGEAVVDWIIVGLCVLAIVVVLIMPMK